MDTTEARVLAFAQGQGLTNLVYEPDGNIPPDFASGNIAIEARRLNQHDRDGDGLDVSGIPLVMRFRKLLASLGPPRGATWFVSFQYRRPIEQWETLSPKIHEALYSFAESPKEGVTEVSVADWFTLRIARASESSDNCFVLAGYGDLDAGGFIVSELIRNLKVVIPEKTKKIQRYISRYQEWWLVLVDHINYGHLDANEIDLIRHYVIHPTEWKRIVLIDPTQPSHGIDI